MQTKDSYTAYYTPPTGDNVALALERDYTPAAGNAVALEIYPLPRIIPGVYCVTASPFVAARKLRPLVSALHTDPPPKRPEVAAPWQHGEHHRAEPSSVWPESEQRQRDFGIPYSVLDHVSTEPAAKWIDADRRRDDRALAWDDLQPVRDERAGISRQATPHRGERASTWEPGSRLQRSCGSPIIAPTIHHVGSVYPWDLSRRVRWSERWWKEGNVPLGWTIEGIAPDVYTPPPGSLVPVSLVCPLIDWPGYSVWLMLREKPCPRGGRSLVIMNSLSVVRLPDLTPVPCSALSLSTDFETWAWGVTLTLPDRTTLNLVSPEGGEKREVRITVNGYTWTAVIESYDERRQFGKPGYSVQGRSRSAYLAAPFSAPTSYVEEQARNAAQLAEAALGASGWALDWGTVDWLVPGGVFAYQGKTPMEVISTIAAAVGARIQSDMAGDTLHVLPRYPVSPWGWSGATPDASLTGSLIESVSARYSESPAWQGVYVSGQSQGVLVNVKRVGSDGTPTAPMIVDPLITTVAAGTERGRIALAEGGAQTTVGIELPILYAPEQPGLLLPGMLVDVDDTATTWRGLVTGCRVEAGRPVVRQIVQVERHSEATP